MNDPLSLHVPVNIRGDLLIAFTTVANLFIVKYTCYYSLIAIIFYSKCIHGRPCSSKRKR